MPGNPASVPPPRSSRRQRDATPPDAPSVAPPTASKSKTVADAKVRFAASVSRGISVLMEEGGYSRERAQTTLLREIARGDNNPPGDEEIFHAMSSLGIGIEGAARALTVSRALQRETAERNVGILDAIDELTSKLSVANLFRVDRGGQSSVTTTSPCDSMPPRASKVRIQPVAPRQTTTSSCSSNMSNTTMTSSTSGRKAKSVGKTAKQKHGNGNRKRPVEDISASINCHPGKEEVPDASFQTRARSDSLSEVVSAKFGDGKLPAEDASSAVRQSALPSPAVVRAKRGRVDDGEPSHNALKRSRAGTDH